MGGGGWERRRLVGTTHTCAELQGSWHGSKSHLRLESSRVGTSLKHQRKTNGRSPLEAQETGHSYKL